MVLPIQRRPVGLDGLIGSPGAELPRELGLSVTPTVDITQFFGNESRQLIGTSSAALAQQSSILLTVPTARTWVIFGAVATVFGDAGITALGWSLDFTDMANQSLALVQRDLRGLAAAPLDANDELSCCWTPPYPFVMRGGESLRLKLARLTGVASASVALRAIVGLAA